MRLKTLLCLLCCAAFWACGDKMTEEGLREAATAYVAAMEAGDADTLRKYEFPDVDVPLAMSKMKASYSNLRLDSVNATGSEGQVTINATVSMFGARLEVPLQQQWQYADGGWKLVRKLMKFGFDSK